MIANTEFLTARPAIPGLRFRHFAGPQDYPGMAGANMACTPRRQRRGGSDRRTPGEPSTTTSRTRTAIATC